MKLVRYADDFVVLIAGQRVDAESLWEEVGSGCADGPAPVGGPDDGLPHR